MKSVALMLDLIRFMHADLGAVGLSPAGGAIGFWHHTNTVALQTREGADGLLPALQQAHEARR
jgi:hypothetical protein